MAIEPLRLCQELVTCGGVWGLGRQRYFLLWILVVIHGIFTGISWDIYIIILYTYKYIYMYIIWLVLWNAISIFNPILWNQTNRTTGWSRELEINVGVWLVCVIQLKASAKRDGETISSNSWASTGPCISKVFHIRVASCVFRKERYWTVGHESHDHVLPHVFF